MPALRPLQPIGTSATPSGAAGGRATSFIDPHTLMRIKSLQLRAKVVVEGFYSGLHRSPYHGFSVEFSEYRQYTPGDDPRYLDWLRSSERKTLMQATDHSTKAEGRSL